MTGKGILIFCLIIIEVVVTLIFVAHILETSDINVRSRKNFLLSAIKEFFEELFYNKNWFGIVLNIPIIISLIPGIIICLAYELILWVLFLIVIIYELGDKKEDKSEIGRDRNENSKRK